MTISRVNASGRSAPGSERGPLDHSLASWGWKTSDVREKTAVDLEWEQINGFALTMKRILFIGENVSQKIVPRICWTNLADDGKMSRGKDARMRINIF